MKNVFLLFFFVCFYCGTVFSQSDSTHKKSFSIGLKMDGTLEPYRMGNEEGLRISQGLEMAEGLFSLDPAIVVSRNRSSLCFGPKFIFANSDIYARVGEWKGLRVNYQYTFINPADGCNLFLFYEFAYVHYKAERLDEPGWDGPSFSTYYLMTGEFINHEIGVGDRCKLLNNFYFNLCYGFGVDCNKAEGTVQDFDHNLTIYKWSYGSLTHINRFTGFLRAGLQYDFRL